MCKNFCRDEIFCSGHGQCEAREGLSCICDKTWESESQYNATGPFCTRQPTTQPGTSHSAKKKASLTMILATSVPVAVVVLLVASVVYWYVTRQAREAAALRKTILDFGQSHSHLDGNLAKQIIKERRKKEIEESPAAVIIAAGKLP
jgi:Tfp pilus assembly protein PilN